MASSLIGLGLVLRGGYGLFEKVMGVCIAIMFVTVVVTAIALWPGTSEVVQGLFVPSIPDFSGIGLTWTVALIGGVGGTLTIMCYGYWLREEGRAGVDELSACRIDLGTGYVMTAIFGVAMVIVGSTVEIEGQGTTLLVSLADRLEGPLGLWGRALFLIGAFGAVFSSLLGVWQSIPYLFADSWRLITEPFDPAVQEPVDTNGLPYRGFMITLGIVPMIGLFWGFQQVQKFYTITGALFFPFLALALLIWNGRSDWVGTQYKNHPITSIALIGVLVFFSWLALRTVFGL